MKPTRFILMLLTPFVIVTSYAQHEGATNNFTGAAAGEGSYKAVYYLNDSATRKVQGTLRNIKNALEDPRLAGKLQIELVVFGDGVEVFKKTNSYDTTLRALQSKGVILAQCLNTMKERHIGKAELWDFISYVPTGNGEVIIRQAQGWAPMHP